MKATDIQIGDWLQNTNGNIGKAQAIYRYHNPGDKEFGYEIVMQYNPNGTCYTDLSLLKPIPLTAEILEKNGFVKCIGGRSKKSLQLIGDGLYVSWWNDRIVIRYKRVLGHPSAYLNCDCRYVHDLQHALRLCGIEKEITI